MRHRQAGRRGSGRPGGTHSPCRGFAAGPAFLASSSFSCPEIIRKPPCGVPQPERGRFHVCRGTKPRGEPDWWCHRAAPGTRHRCCHPRHPPSHQPGGRTYVVVPRGPRRVELRVQLPLLPCQLVVLRLLLPRQRVPLRGGEGKKHGVNPGAVQPAPGTRGHARPSHLVAIGVPTTSPGPLPRAGGAPG